MGDLDSHLIGLFNSLGPSKPTTQTAFRSFRPFFAQLTTKCNRACPGMYFPLKIDASYAGSGFPSNTCFRGPTQSVTQTISRSVQPFLHSSRQTVVGHDGARPSPSKLPLPMGSGPPCIPCVHPSQHPKRHLDRLTGFAWLTIVTADRRTDRQTTLPGL